MQENSDIIKVFETDNFTEIEILDNCSLLYFYSELSKKISIEKFKLININSIFSENNIEKKRIYIIKKENKVYNIITKTEQKNIYKYTNTIISEKTFINDEINEIIITLLPNNNYSIQSNIQYKNGVIKNIKLYDKKKTNDYFHFRNLSKKEALKRARNVINNIDSIKDINKIIDTNLISSYMNIILDRNYNQIISDEDISLSKNNNTDEYIDNFDIILNKTLEKVGRISIYHYNDNYYKYEGNISYEIYEDYRNKRFATKALKLLKIYLQKNNINQDLYISTEIDNNYSQKVAIKNGAKLIYEGAVPENEEINYIDGIKNVKIYKIEAK